MSDCHDCDNVGWTWEFAESSDDELAGEWHKLPCRNWRHRVRPTLEEIVASMAADVEPPRTHLLPETNPTF